MRKQKENLHEVRRRRREEWLYWHRQIGGDAWQKEDKTEARRILKNAKEAYKALEEIEGQIMGGHRK